MIDPLIDEALARVVRWMAVPESWAGHRPEPFAAERLWACTIEGVGSFEAGLDDQGRAVIVRPAEAPSGSFVPRIDVVEYAPDGSSITVHGLGRAGAARATTSFDRLGRPVTTTYSGDAPDERYRYAGDGRLASIDESPGFLQLTRPMWRDHPSLWFAVQTTERLDVEWEGEHASAVRRANDGLVVWQRLRVSWPDALQGFAQRFVETTARSLAETVRRFEIQPRDEVFGFALVTEPAPDGTANMGLWAGLQSTRDRLLADPAFGPDAVEEYLWLLQDPYLPPPAVAAAVALPDEDDSAALRAAAMHDPGDARSTLAQATVPLLAAHDWSPMFITTPDFAVHVIGFDDSYRDMYDSMVAGNPPERLAERAIRWRGSPYPPST